jgi:hypothetical protein
MILTWHPATDRSQVPRAGGLLCMSFRLGKRDEGWQTPTLWRWELNHSECGCLERFILQPGQRTVPFPIGSGTERSFSDEPL